MQLKISLIPIINVATVTFDLKGVQDDFAPENNTFEWLLVGWLSNRKSSQKKVS